MTTVPDSLDGSWCLARESGFLPPLSLLRKRIEGRRGWTIAGPIEVPFDVDGLDLRYRGAFAGIVDSLTPGEPGTYHGTTTVYGRHVGTFRMTRAT